MCILFYFLEFVCIRVHVLTVKRLTYPVARIQVLDGQVWASSGAAPRLTSYDRRSQLNKLIGRGADNACNGHLSGPTARVQAVVHKRRSRPPQETR